MDAIMCATMGNNLVELRHYYSRDHNVDRQNLVRKKIIYNSPHQCWRFVRVNAAYHENNNRELKERNARVFLARLVLHVSILLL